MDYGALRAELQSDPAALGYSGMTAAQAAAKLNATNTSRTISRKSIAKSEVLSAIVDADWPVSLVAQNKLLVLFSVDTLDPTNANTRAIVGSIFGPATATRANLLALASRTASRAEELGLGVVTEGDVVLSRGGVW